ncbi:response regulator [Pelobacter propionicus]|uniref:response regulator n=1 Tax=Pelobacter propionicus TaxID=29543 RepID=UPI000057B2C5|nr:response regulator [Pelobacter propionicus]
MHSVLIVDDIAENRYFLEVLLRGNGFAVRSAGNGAEALESARSDPPDLIVSDILMPVMDGYTFCRECKSDDRLRRIPFIFYTATYTEKKDQELALSLGADRFVIKPQEPEALLSLLQDVLTASRDGGRHSSTEESHGGEGLLKEYSEVLFHKLEQKMAELEQTNRELEQKIAEQKRTEEQLRQAQKMEAIGRFSTGIAHDFNNILTVVVGYAYLVQMKLAKDDRQREWMDQILAAVERAKNLTRSLLAFSRKEELKLELIDLNNSIRNVETFLRRVIGEDITLMLSLKEGGVPIFADQGHIEQVLMNLATNARDAMPKGGILSIGTDVVDMDEVFIKTHGYGTAGWYAAITVADSGIGMDGDTRQRIFEPFFTTKETGRGTGLGLSIIYGIVQQHDGYITVYSEPGQGATFRIYLPLAQGEASSECALPAKPLQMARGSETLLVVDDEAPIREYLKLYLTELGYGVLLARDGQEAVDLFREQMHEIDLVLMDVILPNKNGREAASEIREMRNDCKIIFSSGYPHDLVHGRRLLDHGEHLLMKPLTPTELAVKVRAVLDGEAGGDVPV